MTNRELLLNNQQLQRKIDDMLVVIDTLQTNMRTVASYLSDDQQELIQIPSYKWCVNWKPDQS